MPDDNDRPRNPLITDSPLRKKFQFWLAVAFAVAIVILAIWLSPAVCDQTFCSPA